MRSTLTIASALTCASLLTASATAQSGSAALYEVRFVATWSSTTHPGAYPGGAHFSPLIGATHDGSVNLWQPGGIATNGIEVMAETGSTGPLTSEINALINASTAGERITGGAPNSPGMTSSTFLVTEDFPLVSLVTMIAPSPDWFVGVDSLPLMQNGEWVDVTVDLFGWDSGTDSGTNFTSGNQNTNPQDPIALLTSGPLGGTDALGTFTFTRIPLGDNYCGPAVPNSTGVAGSIFALGSGTAGESLTLVAEDLAPNQFGYFVVSDQTGMVNPMGSSGTLCLGGNIGRFNAGSQIGNSGSAGTFSLVADTSNLPVTPSVAVQPGETWHFQAWYRDTGATSNFTDGLSVQFN